MVVFCLSGRQRDLKWFFSFLFWILLHLFGRMFLFAAPEIENAAENDELCEWFRPKFWKEAAAAARPIKCESISSALFRSSLRLSLFLFRFKALCAQCVNGPLGAFFSFSKVRFPFFPPPKKCIAKKTRKRSGERRERRR